VAALCKINGVLGLVAVLLYDALRGAQLGWRGSLRASWPALRPSWDALRPRVTAVGFCVAFFLAGLGALDNYWTEFRGPLEHLGHMVHYHAGLTHVGPSTGADSSPLGWWLNQGEINYYTSTVGGRTDVRFRAAMNEYIIWAAPLALLYAGHRAWAAGSKLAAFAVASFVANFAPPFLAWAIQSRTSYIYYMVPSMPAFACAIAAVAERVPRPLLWCFAGAVLYAFFFSFPIRSLP
jgi:hypothetical protein